MSSLQLQSLCKTYPGGAPVLRDVADALGWCTWDAFYKEVTPDKVLQGLHCHLLPGGVRRLRLMR